MAKKNLYADWLKAEQTNINNAPAIVSRPATTVGNNPSYADVMLRNEQIRNTPETARGGYSALAPGAIPQYQRDALSGYTAKQGYESVAPFADPTAKAAPATVPASATTPATGSTFSFANLDDASKAKLKQNNPAFYNQLLVQGIISPLAEDQKPATVQTATVPKPAAGSPSTGDTGATGTDETEPTGYAKYLAMHPEYAEADRRAEADYARALPTYGALAEQMAQAGIHGGYSDYLQGVAYAKMQDAKQQNEEAARAGYAAQQGTSANPNVTSLYQAFTTGGTDAEGNAVEGLNLQNIFDDETYDRAVTEAKVQYKNLGYSDADIETALKGVAESRTLAKDNLKTAIGGAVDSVTSGAGTEEDVLNAYKTALGVDFDIPQRNENESDEDYASRVGASIGQTAKEVVLDAYKNGLIGQEQVSAYLKGGLSIYEDDFAERGWKTAGEDIYSSVKNAEKWVADGTMTQADFDKVLEDAVKQSGIKQVYTGGDLSGFFGTTSQNDDVTFQVALKDQKAITIKADHDTSSDAKGSTLEYLKQYKNTPLAVYKGSIYFQYKPDKWVSISTKTGSKGTVEEGNNYLYTIALYMMRQNNYKGVGTANMVGKIQANQ